MNPYITIISKINTTTNVELSNTYATIYANTRKLLDTGKAVITLNVWKDEQSSNENYDNIIPIVIIEDTKRIVRTYEVQLTQQEVLGPDLPGTIFNKAAKYLEDTYEWEVIINQ